jgi:hypothetical protein
MAEPTSKFESVMRHALPTDKDAAVALGLPYRQPVRYGIPGGTLSSSAGSTSSTVASLAMISSPG